MLQILGGAWGGQKLHVPSGAKLRPSAGRVKEAIFSILTSMQMKRGESGFSDWRCLDLFAGVGGLGFEALSRGAVSCVFVEKDKRNVWAIKKNAVSLGCEENAAVLSVAVEKWEAWGGLGPYDLVFLDPPYERDDEAALLALLTRPGVLSPNAIVVFEHAPSHKVAPTGTLQIHSERRLGPAGLSVFICGR